MDIWRIVPFHGCSPALWVPAYASMMAARFIRPSGLRIKSAMTVRGVRVEDVRIMIYRIGTMLVHRFYPLVLVSSTGIGS